MLLMRIFKNRVNFYAPNINLTCLYGGGGGVSGGGGSWLWVGRIKSPRPVASL